jgi:hypothetical protein
MAAQAGCTLRQCSKVHYNIIIIYSSSFSGVGEGPILASVLCSHYLLTSSYRP